MENSSLKQLIEVSNSYGNNSAYVIAGGGNTSYKNEEKIWVKASGTSLATIKEDGFVSLSRNMLKTLATKTYSSNNAEREEQVKQDLNAAIIEPKHLRPSVETSMHEIIDFSYIVHTHPTFVNALMCSKNVTQLTKEIFGDDVIYIEYTDPGYILFKKVLEKITEFKEAKGFIPNTIFLQNHGVFVGANSVEEINDIYTNIEEKLTTKIKNNTLDATVQTKESDNLSIAQKYFADKDLLAKGYTGELIQNFIKDNASFVKIEKPFTPDIIVYCKSNYLFIPKGTNAAEVNSSIDGFNAKHGYMPKVLIFENDVLVISEDTDSNIQKVLEVFIDMMKISLLSENFGGQNFMTQKQIDFIDNWEVENYRRKVAKES